MSVNEMAVSVSIIPIASPTLSIEGDETLIGVSGLLDEIEMS